MELLILITIWVVISCIAALFLVEHTEFIFGCKYGMLIIILLYTIFIPGTLAIWITILFIEIKNKIKNILWQRKRKKYRRKQKKS